jgi:hypothetical protein
MLEPPLARGTDIAALADVTAPSTKATTAGIFKLDTFMAFHLLITMHQAGRYIGEGPTVARH